MYSRTEYKASFPSNNFITTLSLPCRSIIERKMKTISSSLFKLNIRTYEDLLKSFQWSPINFASPTCTRRRPHWYSGNISTIERKLRSCLSFLFRLLFWRNRRREIEFTSQTFAVETQCGLPLSRPPLRERNSATTQLFHCTAFQTREIPFSPRSGTSYALSVTGIRDIFT